MGWQQIVMIIWLSACVGIGLVQHGKPKNNTKFADDVYPGLKDKLLNAVEEFPV